MSDSESHQPGPELENKREAKRGRGRPRGPNYCPKQVLEEVCVKRGRGRPKGSFKNKNKSDSGGCPKIPTNKNATSAMQIGDTVVPPSAEVEDELQIPETTESETCNDHDNRSVELPYSERDDVERMDFSLCASGSPVPVPVPAATAYNADTTLTSIGTPKGAVGTQVKLRENKSQFPEPIRTALGRYTLMLTERHQKQAAYVKTRQWCWTCEKRSIFHCCWNTSYCSKECQKIHWNEHKYKCTRQ